MGAPILKHGFAFTHDAVRKRRQPQLAHGRVNTPGAGIAATHNMSGPRPNGAGRRHFLWPSAHSGEVGHGLMQPIPSADVQSIDRIRGKRSHVDKPVWISSRGAAIGSLLGLSRRPPVNPVSSIGISAPDKNIRGSPAVCSAGIRWPTWHAAGRETALAILAEPCTILQSWAERGLIGISKVTRNRKTGT